MRGVGCRELGVGSRVRLLSGGRVSDLRSAEGWMGMMEGLAARLDGVEVIDEDECERRAELCRRAVYRIKRGEGGDA